MRRADRSTPLRPLGSILVLLLVAAPAPAQDAPKLLALEHGTTYALAAADRVLSARVPVRAEPKVTLANLELTIADVVVDGRHDPALLACVTPRKEFDTPGAPAIVLTVTCAHRRPDDYDVTIAVLAAAPAKPARPQTRQTSAPAPVPQKLALKLTRPTPTLRAISAQAVERTVIWGDNISGPSPSRLIISDTSNRTLPLTFTAAQVDNATQGTRSVAGKLAFEPATTDANGRAELALSIADPFPLGTSKTTVEIRSNDLAAPIYVAYEIATRLHWGYVVAAILIGLGLGFLTRTVLKTIVERGAAKVAALDFLDKLSVARARWNQTIFRTAVNRIASTLEDAIRTADAATLKTRVTEADAAFVLAKTALEADVAEILGSIATTTQLTTSPGRFPGAVATALGRAATDLAAAKQRVVGGEVDAGKEAADKITAALAGNVENESAAWRTRLQSALQALDTLTRLPPALQSALTSGLATVRTQIAKAPAPSLSPDIAAILESSHAIAFLAGHDLTEAVLKPLADSAGRAVKILADAGVPAPTIDAASTMLLRAIDDDADTTLEGPAAAAGELVRLLRQEIADAAAAAKVNVSAELAEGRYLDAAAAVADSTRAAAGTGRRPDPEVAGGRAASVPPLVFRARLVPVPSFGANEPIELARARTVFQIAAAKLAQFAVASIGITAVGLLMLLPTFDGTWQGVLAALFWGYAGDISVDALTDAAKKVK
jgi:hypothetical protein